MQWRLFLLFSLGFWACNQTGQMHVAKGKTATVTLPYLSLNIKEKIVF